MKLDMSRAVYLVPLLVMVACHVSCVPKRGQTVAKLPDKILFVGNSFTYVNNGVENHVRELAASASPPRLIQADSTTQGGATLRIHYGRLEVHDSIREGAYDVVILQEDIPELPEHSVEPLLCSHSQRSPVSDLIL